jgi:hypothetical protein
MKSLCMFFQLLSITGTAIAGGADVVAVDFAQADKQTYRFDVTVRHADSGWGHYANRWEVQGPDSSILGTRVLAHPHVNEQPFTRSLANVEIPLNVHQITIKAHDSVHGYTGKAMVINLD